GVVAGERQHRVGGGGAPCLRRRRRSREQGVQAVREGQEQPGPGYQGAAIWHRCVKTVGHLAGAKIDAPFIVWHSQHVDITANEAMAASGTTAKREAREFLLGRLEAGPVKSDELVEEAAQNGISKATLRRAQRDLGIKPRKERGKVDGDWFWELPPQRRCK